MPCLKCNDKKWKIGSGKCIYPNKATCERALRGYYASKHHSAENGKFLEDRKRKFGI